MIDVKELLYELELNINKVASQDNMDVPLEDKILFIRRAELEWIKTKINPNNIYRAGFEELRKRIDDLQALKVPDKKIQLKRSSSVRYISYTADLSTIPDYMFYVDSYTLAKTKTCEDTIGVDLIREGELSTKYFSSHHEPSFLWRSTISTISDNKMYVYSGGKFEPTFLYVTYLRYPLKTDREGYIHFDGTPSVDQNSELPEYAKQDIVDLATKYVAHSLENQLQAQLVENRLIKNE
jgi:hypothetical protein